MSSLFQRAELTVQDPETFSALRSKVEAAFSGSGVQKFLKDVHKSGLRVRDFALVLAKGKLGKSSESEYNRLQMSDQGQIRELYLSLVERVDPAVREQFFKLYARY